MRIHLILFCIIFNLLNLTQVHAEAFGLEVSPIIGYDQSQSLLPTPHSTTRLVYGAQAIAGILMISAEAQYTHGISQETFNDLSQTDTADKAKLGLRSGFRLGALLSTYLRAGVQASIHKYDQTQAGVSTSTTTPITYAPYAGLGGRAALSNKLWASTDIVAVIPNVKDMTQNEYQVTAGFGIHLP